MKKQLSIAALLLLGPALAYLIARPRPAAEADQATPTVGFQDWAKALEARGIQVSAGVWDLQSGKLQEGWKERQLLVPASTTKAVTTYAMLKTWKPNFTVLTEIWGDLQGDTVKGDLTFKGAGDPELTSERIWTIAEQLKKAGVKRIEGSVKADESAFDGQRYGNGWEDTTKNVWPPIVPLSVDFDRPEEGSAYAPDPAAFATETITRILQNDGIQVEGRAVSGDHPRRLLEHESPALRSLIQDINKFSNNFMVETLAKKYGDGSWPVAVGRIQNFYKTNFGLGPEDMQLTDASGLSKQNRLSARTLAIVLRSAWFDFETGPEYVASLKVQGGEPFRLRHKDENLTRRVRVKSGYLSNARSLTGYLQTLDGRIRVFAIILNGDSKEDDIWDQVSRWAN